ncbi:MAG: NAD(P)-dependent oxidoreductase [Tissierellia bacterium]|nr:NAD(P)-dependent oxidoreductase [Bacillota bacterium]NLK58588.1 NAD(P)-dependent oxidoreductase [Tissierellia bacterium]
MELKKRIWIVGRSGRLGAALENLLVHNRDRFEVLSTDVDDLNILDAQAVERYAERNRPDIIVNCAAYSNRGWCEEHVEETYALHAIGARNLAIIANQIGARIFYLSSDFVYDGTKTTPYTEFDTPNPQTVYGTSKRAGEMFVRTHCKEHTILRTSWLYGKKMLNEFIDSARKDGKVITGQPIIGTPTSSLTLAETILRFFDLSEYGTFHISCEGECSLEEFIREVLRLAGSDAPVETGGTPTNFERLRPRYSVLDNFMLRITGNQPVPHWKEALARFMKERKVGGVR